MIAAWIVFLPLAAALITGLGTRQLGIRTAQWITTGATMLAAILSWSLLPSVVFDQQSYILTLMPWISSGSFAVEWALRIDSLSVLMLVLITSVSALVHLYSIGYMHEDPHPQRFMSYLSLFTFFMLLLVTANNFLQLFVGWEGVGLCSYLLIGFWYKKESANAAAMKAFIVNRVGDFSFALGVLGVFFLFGDLGFDAVFASAPTEATTTLTFLGQEWHALTVICLLLFGGAMGKSAQLGLHTWLPDAMEGPTPVSALIHAATMVTAGVFLVARCSPLFELSPLALDVVTLVGAATCLFAATIAVTQNDIKRVIAYSTCSQLGYMFFACGVSAYAAGMFHLFTHGFFKALLFLGAGSVIHALHHEQDMRKMGGIWRKIPLTYAMMLLGTLAIVGLPPFSGYFSKDMILESAFAAGAHGHRFGYLAYILGVSAALLTAFYSWRLVFLTFHGKCRASKKVQAGIHESPKVMTIPLILLSLGALGMGALGSMGWGIVDSDMRFWNGALKMGQMLEVQEANAEVGALHANVLEAAHHIPWWAKKLPVWLSLAGFFLAWLCYLRFPTLPATLATKCSAIYRFLLNKWYIDELYDWAFVQPSKRCGRFLWQAVDQGIIDRFGPNGIAGRVRVAASFLSRVQSGYVYHYAFAMMIGLVVLVSGLFFLVEWRG